MPISVTKYTPTSLPYSYVNFSAGQFGATGVGDITVQWRKEVTPFKLLNDTEPTLLWGRTTGRIRIGQFLLIPTVTADNTLFTAWPPASAASAVITLVCAASVGAPEYSASFTGYTTSKSMLPRQLAPHVWVVDAGTELEIFN